MTTVASHHQEAVADAIARGDDEMETETYNMSVDEVEALMRLYQELPDEMIKRMFDEDGDLIEAGNFLHRLYHWNREHFSL